jgi:transposase
VVALDLHKEFSRAVVMDGGGDVLDDRRILHADRGEMQRFLDEFDAGTDVVMEATFNWPWVVDIAEKCGVTPHLGDPTRIKEFRRGLAKSDRKDCVAQGTLWLRKMFPEVYIAPPCVRRMRGVFRMRGLFVRLRTKVKNNIHGQLFKLGVTLEESDYFSLRGRRELLSLELDRASREELSMKLAVLEDLDRHIAEVEEIIRKDLRNDPRAQILDSLPGFGEIASHGFLAEMGEVARFPNGRALAAYAGVLPLDNESADRDLGRRTGKHSNRFLRWILLEAVTGAIRKSPRMRSLYERVKEKNPDRPGKARVAVARELCELAHLLLTREKLYTECRPPRPGSPEARAAEASAKKSGDGEAESRRPRKSFPLTGRRMSRGKGRRPSDTQKG